MLARKCHQHSKGSLSVTDIVYYGVYVLNLPDSLATLFKLSLVFYFSSKTLEGSTGRGLQNLTIFSTSIFKIQWNVTLTLPNSNKKTSTSYQCMQEAS